MTEPSIPDVLRQVIEWDGGCLVTDPNGVALLSWQAQRIAAWQPFADKVSDLSGRPGCLVFRADSYALTLTPDELHRFVSLALTPTEFFAVRRAHGDQFMWHDDFYDPDIGVALQPRTEW